MGQSSLRARFFQQRHHFADDLEDPAAAFGARESVAGSYGGYAALQSGVFEPGLFKAIVAIAPVTDLQLLKTESRFWVGGANTREFIGDGPHVQAGSPAQNAGRIAVPVLMFHGDKDINVDIDQSRRMEDRLEDVGADSQLVVFDGLDHGLRDSTARARMLAQSDRFLRNALGLPQLSASQSPSANPPSAAVTTPPRRPNFPGAETPEDAHGVDEPASDDE